VNRNAIYSFLLNDKESIGTFSPFLPLKNKVSINTVSYPLSLRERARVRVTQNAFTLIELLVVIVIVGIIITMATLSMGVLGRDNQVEDQAKRLYAVMTQAREEAELQGRDFGVLIERDGYLFMRYDHMLNRWMTLDYDDLLAYRELPEGLQFRLWMDGREVILKTHEENKPLLSRSHSSTSSSSSSSSSLGTLLPSPTSSNSTDLRPQIAVLSSGDVLPFELQLARDGNDFNWHVLGNADNSLTVEANNTKP
jgi:general secretion pathway protein H